MSFTYTQEEIDYLSKKDKKFKEAIEKIGFIDVSDTNPFQTIVKAILASADNYEEIYANIEADLKELSPRNLVKSKEKKLQNYGMTYAQALYIKDLATRVYRRHINLENIAALSGIELDQELAKIPGMSEKGIEVFKSENSGGVPEISQDNELILKGMRMLYRHRAIDDAKFERYSKRYKPHGQVAALYLTAIANGALEGVTDPQPKNKK